jgi:aryl-alcohol dehydrogenase-like predicted oxidoreductase
MEFRHLGNSGLKVSAISYGNWITHGSQLEAEQATACVRAALDVGITTFDTCKVASAITGGSRPDQVTSNAAAAGRKLSPETMAGIDSALGSFVESDGAMVGATSPKQRLR